MKIKFLHIRNRDKEGKILSHGGVTVAYQTDELGVVYGYATAKCHPNDNYHKQIGRDKAKGRLYSDKFLQSCNMSESDFRIAMFSTIWY